MTNANQERDQSSDHPATLLSANSKVASVSNQQGQSTNTSQIELLNHKLVFDSLAGLIVRNADYSLNSVNEKLADLLEFSSDELMTNPALLTPYFCVETRRHSVIQSAIDLEGIGRGEVCFLTKSGKSKWFSQSTVILKNKRGQLDKYHIVLIDISKQKYNEQELNDRQAALDLTTSVSVTDDKGIITYVNDKFCSISKYNKEKLIGRNHNIVSSGFHEKGFIKDLWDNIKSGVTWNGEIKNKSSDGEYYWLDTTIIPFIDSNGKPFQYMAISVDITEKVLAKEKLVKAKDLAIQATNAKDEFLANMSHEIRTPMNAIIGFTELMLSTKTDPEQKEYLDSIQLAGRNLLVIINDILDYAKIDSGEITISDDPFFVNKAFMKSKKTLTSLAQKKGLELQFHEDVNLKNEVLGDEIRLIQVLINLVGNAIKFTEKGRVDVFNSLVNETNEYYEVKFIVKDTGIGIAQINCQKYLQDSDKRKNIQKRILEELV